jgi:phosphoglycerate dehydrogenase-like enzyme
MNVLVSIQQPVPQWQIPAECVSVLRARFPGVHFDHATSEAERAGGLRQCEIAFTWHLNEAELDTAVRLQWVHTSAVAVETFCLPQLFARGIAVSNTRGVQAVPIAEHVMAVVLALAKQIPFTLDNQRRAAWGQLAYVGERQPWLLAGRTLALIGVGTIGTAVAARAAAFGMRVIALRRHAGAASVPGAPGVEVVANLDALLAAADVLVVAAPLTPATEGLIGAAEIARLKRGAVLVNVGRARILDTAALIAALESGHLGGASLDVYPLEPLPPDHPLWACRNVILTPHTSGFRHGHWDDVIDVFSENLRRWGSGEDLLFRVSPELGY